MIKVNHEGCPNGKSYLEQLEWVLKSDHSENILEFEQYALKRYAEDDYIIVSELSTMWNQHIGWNITQDDLLKYVNEIFDGKPKMTIITELIAAPSFFAKEGTTLRELWGKMK